MKTLFLTLLFASLAFAGVAGTKEDSVIVELKRTIQVLEDKQLLFDKAIELNKKEHSVDLKAEIEEVKAQNLTFLVWGGIVAGLTLVGFIAFLYQLFCGTKKMVVTQLSNQIEREKELLTKLIDERDLDSKIKKNMKIAVVYKESINGDLDAALKRLGYMHENKKEDADADLSGYDLIFIDNSKNEFGYIDKDPNSAPGFIKTHDKGNSAFFYYNETRMNDPFKYQTKAQGFANSLSSLNHNLLDVMRYKWVVIDGKK